MLHCRAWATAENVYACPHKASAYRAEQEKKVARILEQRNLSLTPPQWLALEQLAIDMNIRSTKGTLARQHSWRKLLGCIADGEILLTVKEPYHLPAGLDEAVQRLEEQQREQERIAEQQRRVEAHTAQKQAVRKTPVKMQQLNMLDLEPA